MVTLVGNFYSQMKIHVETDRLIMRDLETTDLEGMFLLDSDPDVHHFLGKKPITSKEQAMEAIEYVRGQYEKNGIGRWAVVDKKTNDFIGWSGLKYEVGLREFDYYDLGYRLRKEYWGKGIATETAIESLKYGFNTMGLEEIGGAAAIEHIASNTILQKVGLRFVELFDFEGEPHNCIILYFKVRILLV